MAKRGPKPKKIDPEVIEKEEKQAEIIENKAENIENGPTEEENQVSNDMNLPDKLFRIDEVARYFNVAEGTIRLWLEHGHLQKEKVVGSIRISRESILRVRQSKLIVGPNL